MAFLVVGDPFGATTHSDLQLRAHEVRTPSFRGRACCSRKHWSALAPMAPEQTRWPPRTRVAPLQRGVAVKVIHNASVLTAVGSCGLQLYRYGEAVTIVFFTETWRPDSFYSRIAANRRAGLHTLCLLDIRVKEPTAEARLHERASERGYRGY